MLVMSWLIVNGLEVIEVGYKIMMMIYLGEVEIVIIFENIFGLYSEVR